MQCIFQSWGGDRIICLGDYADDDDLPEGVTSQDYLDFESGFSKSEEEEEEEWTFARWARTNSERGPKQHKYLEYVRRDLRRSTIRKQQVGTFKNDPEGRQKRLQSHPQPPKPHNQC